MSPQRRRWVEYYWDCECGSTSLGTVVLETARLRDIDLKEHLKSVLHLRVATAAPPIHQNIEGETNG